MGFTLYFMPTTGSTLRRWLKRATAQELKVAPYHAELKTQEARVSRGRVSRDSPSYSPCSRDVDVKAVWW